MVVSGNGSGFIAYKEKGYLFKATSGHVESPWFVQTDNISVKANFDCCYANWQTKLGEALSSGSKKGRRGLSSHFGPGNKGNGTSATIERERERERQTDIQIDRQRQKDRQTERQTNRVREKERERERERVQWMCCSLSPIFHFFWYWHTFRLIVFPVSCDVECVFVCGLNLSRVCALVLAASVH